MFCRDFNLVCEQIIFIRICLLREITKDLLTLSFSSVVTRLSTEFTNNNPVENSIKS